MARHWQYSIIWRSSSSRNIEPVGLAGEAIPVAARVLCVADVFDALTTTRSYRTAFSQRAALEIMQGDAGHIFDPRLFELFDRLVREERGAGAYVPAFRNRAAMPGRLPAGLREPPMPV